MHDVGLGTWAFGVAADEPLPLPEALDLIVGWGYRAVDYGALPPHPSPKPGTPELQLLRNEFASRSLKVTALAPSFSGLSTLRTSDHDEYIDRFSDYLAVCNALDCAIIRVDTLDSPEDGARLGSSVAIERIASVWSRCADAATARGVTIAWEFEPCCVLNTPDEIYTLIAELDRPGIGVLYDTAHAHAVAEVGARHVRSGRTLAGGQPELIDGLADRIVHVHVLDSDGSLNKVPGTTIHVPIGRGHIPFSSVIPALAAAAGGVHWTIDLCFWNDPAAVAESSRIELENLLERYAPTLSSGGRTSR